MHATYLSAALAACGAPLAAALAVPQSLPFEVDLSKLAPALPLSAFGKNPWITPITLEEAKNKVFHHKNESESTPKIQNNVMAAAATCSSPKTRWEWDSASDDTKRLFTDAVKCLLNKPPSGQFGPPKNRYEDLVYVHQMYTPNIHNNAKFLLWHRYYVWVFEDMLRGECGFTNDMPWFDETKYSGHFSDSSLFSDKWFGRIGLNGGCVTTGVFAGLTCNIGPEDRNQPHCLARNGDASKTQNTNQQMVDACNARTDFADMAGCQEGGVHAWGHNGIGAVMQDVWASPSDPVFFLHHMFVDRNYRNWQLKDGNRITQQGLSGRDVHGDPITLDMWMNSAGLRPDMQVKDVIDTMGGKMCYRYNN